MFLERSPLVRDALSREKRAIARALAAGLLVTLSTVGLAGTSAWLIVRAAQRPSVLSLTVPMGLVQLFALAKAAGRYLERTQTHRAALGVMGHARATVAALLEPLVPAGLGPRSAEVVDLVVRDVDRVQDLLTAVAGPLATSVAAGLVTASICGLVVPWTAAVLVVALFLGAVAVPVFAASAGASSEGRIDAARAQMVALFDEASRSGDEYVMSGASAGLVDRLADLERRLDRARARRTLVAGAATTLGVLASGGAAAAALVLTSSALSTGHVSAVLIAVPVLLVVAVLELVAGVSPALAGWRGDVAALGRIESLAHLAAPVVEPTILATNPGRASPISMRDVGLAYDGRAVVSGVSMDLAAGDVVVVAGPSGCGKTTLARVIARFVDPTSGRLGLGDADYRTLTSVQVRSHVGYVDDTPYVFATSLGANLRVARPDATDDELRAALSTVGLSALLASMPEGLDTPIGGAAVGLSGGERRRLGVARELLVDRPVVVLDEPTEGLDEETANELLAAVAARYRGACLVVISHRGVDAVGPSRRFEVSGDRLSEVASV